ncbi:hypothetical protein QA597_05145 [Marinilabiliaceae bacterium ANBcel2]|nr:hypothetical protein [Marinilabiliaceae bacterium ANBcel2]
MSIHTFHIPVMGIGFTIDSPIKIAHLGISSAISLVDDILIERMRELYSNKYDLPYSFVPHNEEDSRAKRITAYLNTVNTIVNQKVSSFKESVIKKRDELNQLIDILPPKSLLKENLIAAYKAKSNSLIYETIEKYYKPGSIDVNIMTKLDKANYKGGEELPAEYNDAHAALRGFANSKLNSSVVLSAGMSPRLYSYIENFEDFYPDKEFNLKKRIILKVSDYRSAIVQGKMFAKKGLWVSEFRVESGLNCGGHAFATQGILMGPILKEFSKNREELKSELFEIYSNALKAKEKHVPANPPQMLLTAQGGVGTSEEHNFLLSKYNIDSVGWGSPFLLVPEASSTDKETIDLLSNAKEDDFYLSDISPVGVRFNNVKGNSRDKDKESKISQGKPGAACTKNFLMLNKDSKNKPICTASRKYQNQEIQKLNLSELSKEEYKKKYDEITVKSCICNGLGVSTLKAHNMDTKHEGDGVSVCPGPNLAYFTKKVSLKMMVNHIYGETNIIEDPEKRPSMFAKELQMYVNYIKEELSNYQTPNSRKIKEWQKFITNLELGANYCKEVATQTKPNKLSSNLIKELTAEISNIKEQIKKR